MTSPIFQLLAGTIASTFRIGKSGPTIKQGSGDPNATEVAGSNGDLFIKHGASPRLFQRSNGRWIDPTAAFSSVLEVNGASAMIPEESDFVYVATAAGNVSLTLPEGYTGKKLTIKDSSGTLISGARSITLAPREPSSIDGSPTLSITVDYTSISLVYAGGNWMII